MYEYNPVNSCLPSPQWFVILRPARQSTGVVNGAMIKLRIQNWLELDFETTAVSDSHIQKDRAIPDLLLLPPEKISIFRKTVATIKINFRTSRISKFYITQNILLTCFFPVHIHVIQLIDGENHTCDDRHMWLIPFTIGQKHRVRIELGKFFSSSAFSIFSGVASSSSGYSRIEFTRYYQGNAE